MSAIVAQTHRDPNSTAGGYPPREPNRDPATWQRDRRGGGWLDALLRREHAPVIALVLSLLGNVLLMLVATQFGVATGGGGGTGAAREFDLTVTSEATLTAVPEASLVGDVPAVTMPSDLPELPTAGILDGAGGVDSPGEGPGLGEIADGLGGAGGGDIGEGAGLGGGAGGGSAKFFGVEARGSRFAYVVDVSGSMGYNEGRKLAQLKGELTESLNGLLEHMGFCIVAFSDAPQVLGGRLQWSRASQADKSAMRAMVGRLAAEGGTQPWTSLEQVLTMRPPPDAIYFMTDGEFDPDVARMVMERNRGARKIPIHCIAFGDAAAEELMRKIATDSGGTYRHVKGPAK